MNCLVCGEPSDGRLHLEEMEDGAITSIACITIFEHWWPTITETPCSIVKRLDPAVVKRRLQAEGRGFKNTIFRNGLAVTSVEAKFLTSDAPLIPALGRKVVP